MEKKFEHLFRVPRAPNLKILKSIMLKTDNKIEYDINKFPDFTKKSFWAEYVKLLKILGWVNEEKEPFFLSQKGLTIKFSLQNNSNGSADDLGIIKDEILSLRLIRFFLKEIFDFNYETISNDYCKEKNKCYLLGEIYEKYHSYRNISKNTSNREARLIVNWLLQLGLLESLPSFDKNFSIVKSCYHIIGNSMNYQEFERIITNPEIFVKIQNQYKKRSNWIEIPLLRKWICVQYCISLAMFNENLIAVLQKNPNIFSLSKSTIIRTEVVNEGLKYDTDIYFYIRMNPR